MPNIYPCALFATSLLIAACSRGPSDELARYRSDADAYCEAHSVEYWQSSGKLDALNAMRPGEKATELMKTFRQTVQTSEMAKIIFDEGGNLPAKEFYPYLQKNIPKFTKLPFDCPEIPEFYLAR